MMDVGAVFENKVVRRVPELKLEKKNMKLKTQQKHLIGSIYS